jgi:uncharacterized surface protein with fasciclin (FAS1) repeats
MKQVHSTKPRKFAVKLLSFLAVFVFIASSCNQSEDEIVPLQEDMPSLTEALEAFDEEVEYTEFTNVTGAENARWAFKRWKRKPTFFTLVAALNYTGLLKTVIQNDLTIFAPDDKAFAELGLNFWNLRHKISKDDLSAVLLNHVAGGFVFARDLDCSLQTVGNTTLRVLDADGKIVFQDDSKEVANILFTDRRALNSVFHGIDKVLMFDELPGTIADIAIAASTGEEPQFTQLVAALVRADLVGLVSDPDANLTVFAPIDEAFFNLYRTLKISDVDDLPEEVLVRVLAHHVVEGRVFSNCLANGEVKTLNQSLTVDLDGARPTLTSSSGNTVNLGLLDGETLAGLDIKASNGAIHIIDGVLVPANYLGEMP